MSQSSDADPNHPIARWEAGRSVASPTAHLTICKNEDEEHILDDIDAAAKKNDFVIVDLEGTANLSVAYAISKADLVIIPSQRSTLDTSEAAKAIGLVQRQSNITQRAIPVAVLLTRTSPAIRSKGLKRMLISLQDNN